MKLLLLLIGALVWIGVGVLSVAMAIWDEPVWGFVPIVVAVVAAWAIGEYLTDSYLAKEETR